MHLDIFLKQVGQNIANLRKQIPMNQVDLAEKAGVSYRYFQRIEAGGANITMSTLHRLAKFFGVHPCDLLPSDKQRGE